MRSKINKKTGLRWLPFLYVLSCLFSPLLFQIFTALIIAWVLLIAIPKLIKKAVTRSKNDS
jgi:uncharacterized membrane protein YhdT